MVDVGQARRIAAAYAGRARLVTTRGLGHRRILGDPEVVETVLDFVTDGRRAGTVGAKTEETGEAVG
jgi:hypothetical protein